MIFEKLHYSLDDLSIVPTISSSVESRSDCNINVKGITDRLKLPIFTAPMSCVVNEFNYNIYENFDIISILPTTVNKSLRLKLMTKQWVAFSLTEIEDLYEKKEFTKYIDTCYICIDCANGHMIKLLEICKEIKTYYKDKVIIMTGNIANPKAYEVYNSIGIDYVRVGIGGGAGCTTSVNTGIHFPMASLIFETYKIKEKVKGKTKIIADGGLSTYGQMIKAFALGADYIMLGKVFLECENGGTTQIVKENKKYNLYWGMSTEKAQFERNLKTIKTEEGFIKYIEVNRTLGQFVREFSFYLSSAMSYCGLLNISDFIGYPILIPITNNAYNQYSLNKPFNSKYNEDNKTVSKVD